MAGALCPENSAKMQSLPEQMLHDLMKQVDYVLIEADGAKHYALKYPSEQEPVIPKGTTDVILVLQEISSEMFGAELSLAIYQEEAACGAAVSSAMSVV